MVYKDISITKKDKNWHQIILHKSSTIGQVVQKLDENGLRIVLVVDKLNNLIGTISDGDVRRGLLKGLILDSPIINIIHYNALVVLPEMSRQMVMQLMLANKIQQIPVVDKNKKLLGLHLWDEITKSPERNSLMVIMVGGKGTRLLPYTQNQPKPMVLVAGKPMLEHIIERAKLEGFKHFVLAIHHLGHVIESHFGNGERLGVKIDYLREQSPLGTAGALGLLNPKPEEPFLVTNGDVITDISYGAMLDFHNRYQASATMAVRIHEWRHPFGVVQVQDLEIVGFEEKPVEQCHINAGVYVLSPEVLNELNAGISCDMPTLFQRLKLKTKRTLAYPMHELWLDVGNPKDLQAANANLFSNLKEGLDK